ncbi:MAG: SCO family protein [Candidatus Polarisedimenticolia bacterium]
MSRPARALAALIWGSLCGVIVLVAAVATWGLMSARAPLAGASAPPAPTVLETPEGLGTIPPFSLVDRTGETVTLDDLRGRWWVADFIFTRCAGICPLLSTRMSGLIQSIPHLERDDVRFVSFTVDPAHDTPDVLAHYASRYRVPAGAADMWMFLTGPRDVIQGLVHDGFRLTMLDNGPGAPPGEEEVTHSERFVLVDPAGRIRGYYHGTDEDSVRRLAEDLETLRKGS